MRTDWPKALTLILLAVAAALACPRAARAQDGCLSEGDIKAMLARVNSSQAAPPDEKLRERLLKLREEGRKDFQETAAGARKEDELMKRLKASREKNTSRLCPLLKEFGWPGAD